MGGSGGGFFLGSTSPEDLARRTRAAEEEAHDESFETEVNGFLAQELSTYNDRDVEGIQRIFDQLKADLAEDAAGTIDLLFGGSVSKHTYVDGISDIDALVLLDRTDLKNEPPKALQSVLFDCLRARYGRANVSAGALAVTVNLKGIPIQLLPALRSGKKLKIADGTGRGWSRIDPAAFVNSLTKTNKAMDGKLVPTIKLAKSIISALPKQRQIIGYHAEALAVQIFTRYKGPKTAKAMLRHFFESAPSHLRTPMSDSTGQSIHIDDDLGGRDSLQRRIVADAFGRIGRRIKNADGARSLRGWKDLFNE